MTRRATLIRQARAANKHVLLLDAGNSLFGDTTPAKSSNGASSVEVMNIMRYDALALAAGDLRIGTRIEKRITEADFAILSANIFIAGTERLLAPPYVLKQIGGHTVALIGVSKPFTRDEYVAVDPIPAIDALVGELTAQADVIILLSHANRDRDLQIAQQVPGIDIIIGGGTKSVPSPLQDPTSGTVLLHAEAPTPGHAGRYMGQGTFQFDAQGTLTSFEWVRIKIVESIYQDPELQLWMTENP